MKNNKLNVVIIGLLLSLSASSRADIINPLKKLAEKLLPKASTVAAKADEAYVPNILNRFGNTAQWAIVGRNSQLTTLTSVLGEDATKLIILEGKPGTGTTSLVVELAKANPNRTIHYFNIEKFINSDTGPGKKGIIKTVSDVRNELDFILQKIRRENGDLFVEDMETLVTSAAMDSANRPIYDPFTGELGELRKAVLAKLNQHIASTGNAGKTIVKSHSKEATQSIERGLPRPGLTYVREIEDLKIEDAFFMISQNSAPLRHAIARSAGLPLQFAEITDDALKVIVLACTKLRSEQGLAGCIIKLGGQVTSSFFNKFTKSFESLDTYKKQIAKLSDELAFHKKVAEVSQTSQANAKAFVGLYSRQKIQLLDGPEGIIAKLVKMHKQLEIGREALETTYRHINDTLQGLKLALEKEKALIVKGTPAERTKNKTDIHTLQLQLKKYFEGNDGSLSLNKLTGRQSGMTILPEDVGAFLAHERGRDITPEKILALLRDEVYIPPDLYNTLQARIVNQPEFIEAIYTSLMRAAAGFVEPNQFLAKLFLFGDSGVGKTHSAKQVGSALNGGTFGDVGEYLASKGIPDLTQNHPIYGKLSTDQLFLVEMRGNEFMAAHAESRLTGAPPGYIGYGEDGLMNALAECVKSGRICIFVADEWEKSSEKIQQVLMEFLDTGKMVANKKLVTGQNVMFIATSNAVKTEHIEKAIKDGLLPENPTQLQITNFARKFAVDSGGMRPEVLGRFDGFMYFNPHNEKSLAETVERFFAPTLARQLDKSYIGLDIDPEIYTRLAHITESKLFGARDLNTTFKRYVSDYCAGVVNARQVNSGDVLKVTIENDQIVIRRLLADLQSGTARTFPLLKPGKGQIVRRGIDQ